MYFNRKRGDGGADLALVWCLKPQSVAAVDVGAVVAVVALACSLQDGPAEEAATVAAAAALESGCCSAAAI